MRTREHPRLAVWKVPAENSVTASCADPKSCRRRCEAPRAQVRIFAFTEATGAAQLKPPPSTSTLQVLRS